MRDYVWMDGEKILTSQAHARLVQAGCSSAAINAFFSTAEFAEKNWQTGPKGGSFYINAAGNKVRGKPGSAAGSEKSIPDKKGTVPGLRPASGKADKKAVPGQRPAPGKASPAGGSKKAIPDKKGPRAAMPDLVSTKSGKVGKAPGKISTPDIDRLKKHVKNNRDDTHTRRILADALEEAGQTGGAKSHRRLADNIDRINQQQKERDVAAATSRASSQKRAKTGHSKADHDLDLGEDAPKAEKHNIKKDEWRTLKVGTPLKLEHPTQIGNVIYPAGHTIKTTGTMKVQVQKATKDGSITVRPHSDNGNMKPFTVRPHNLGDKIQPDKVAGEGILGKLGKLKKNIFG